jgi:hypothetical protein
MRIVAMVKQLLKYVCPCLVVQIYTREGLDWISGCGFNRRRRCEFDERKVVIERAIAPINLIFHYLKGSSMSDKYEAAVDVVMLEEVS